MGIPLLAWYVDHGRKDGGQMVTTYKPMKLGGGRKLSGPLFVDGMALVYFLAGTNEVSIFDLGATGDLLRSALRFMHANEADLRVFVAESHFGASAGSRCQRTSKHSLVPFCLNRYVESVLQELATEGALQLSVCRGHPTRALAAAAKDVDGALLMTNNTDILCFPQVRDKDIVFFDQGKQGKISCEASIGPDHFSFQATVRTEKLYERLLNLPEPAQMPLLATAFGSPLMTTADMAVLHDAVIKDVDLWKQRNVRGPVTKPCHAGDGCRKLSCRFMHGNRLRVPVWLDGKISEVGSMAAFYQRQAEAKQQGAPEPQLHDDVKRELLKRLLQDVRSNGGATVLGGLRPEDTSAVITYYGDLDKEDPNVGAPVARPSPPTLAAATAACVALLTDSATEEQVATAVAGRGPVLSDVERRKWALPSADIAPSDMLLLDAVCAALNAKPGRLPMWPVYAEAEVDEPPTPPPAKAASAEDAAAASATDIAALENTEGDWDDSD